jgi:hypothetical protein
MKAFNPAAQAANPTTSATNEVLGYLNLVLTADADEHHMGGLKLESKKLHRSEPEKVWDIFTKLDAKGILAEHVKCKIVGINIPSQDAKASALTPDEEKALDVVLNKVKGTKEGVELQAFNGGKEYTHPAFAWIKVEVTAPRLLKGWSYTASSCITTGDSRAMLSTLLKLHTHGVGNATLEPVGVYDLNADEELEINQDLMDELGL